MLALAMTQANIFQIFENCERDTCPTKSYLPTGYLVSWNSGAQILVGHGMQALRLFILSAGFPDQIRCSVAPVYLEVWVKDSWLPT